jgi:AhpD family alkylhydroperoxidase
MKQTDEKKIARSLEILDDLKDARGGTLLESHRVMGNDPNLVNAFLQQYINCNTNDTTIPKKYRELIVMAIGMATGTDTTMKVHAKIAMENGATIDEIFEVIRMIFFTCGVSKLLPALENLDIFEAI